MRYSIAIQVHDNEARVDHEVLVGAQPLKVEFNSLEHARNYIAILRDQINDHITPEQLTSKASKEG